MDPARIESIHAGIAAYNSGDPHAFADLVADTAIVIPFEGWPDDRVYYGPEGMFKLMSSWTDAFESTTLEAEGLIESESGERIVALLQMKSVQQGVVIEQRLGSLCDFDDAGRWLRVQFFLGHDAALKAIGA